MRTIAALLSTLLLLPGWGDADTGRRRIPFDPAQFGVLRTLYPEVGRIHSVDASPSERFLVCGGDAGGIAVIRTDRWSPVWTRVLPLGVVSSLAFHPRSNVFAAAGSISNQILLFDAEKKREIRGFSGEEVPVQALAWFPDGKRLVSAGRNGTVRIWDADTGRTLQVLRGHQGPVSSLVVNRDGSRLFTSGEDGIIRLYDSRTWREISSIRAPGLAIGHLQLTRDGKTLYGSARGAATFLQEWDVASGKLLGSHPAGEGLIISGVRLDSSERYVIVSVAANLQVWSRSPTGLVETCIHHRSMISSLAVSPRGRWVISAGSDSLVKIWGRVPGGMAAVPASGFFGVRVQDAGDNLGALVVAVIPGTAASRAGIRANDIISRVGTFAVHDMASTIAAIGIHSAGSKVSFTILREQETVLLKVSLGKRPEDLDP